MGASAKFESIVVRVEDLDRFLDAEDTPKDGGHGGTGKVDLTFNGISATEPEFTQYLSVFTQRVGGLQCIGDDGG